MPLSDLTNRNAVLSAIAEYDAIGQSAFLAKYGFAQARRYYLKHDGRLYDSKAIVGAAYGYQFPDRGPLAASEFTGGEATVRPLLEGLGFTVVEIDEAAGFGITALDIQLIRDSRSKSKFAELKDDERAAYQRVHTSLAKLGALVQAKLGSGDFSLKLTSGFYPNSGVRGYLPKDLWFAVSNVRNEAEFERMPQLFMIVSDRGIECGFAACIPPRQFSDQTIQQRVRAAAPQIFAALPAPGSAPAIEWRQRLDQSGGWFLRREPRADPGTNDFNSLNEWLSFLKSPDGIRSAGGSISRYLSLQDLSTAGERLKDLVGEMAATFFDPMHQVVLNQKPPETGAWIFQANPEFFDARGAVKQLRELRWLVKQHGEEMQVGDRVYLWESGSDAGIVAIAQIATPLQVIESDPSSTPFTKKPEKFEGAQPRVALRVDRVIDPPLSRQVIKDDPALAGLSIFRMAQGTNFPITEEERQALDKLLRVDAMEDLVAYTLLERSFIEEIVSALTQPVDAGGSPQIVLVGPPGTSKTWVAEAIARHISGNVSRVRFVQFHPNYSYEAFVEGLRPYAEGGAITFQQQHGALLSLVDDMRKAGDTNPASPLYSLIVDEMNRANLPRVFGELMYLFEYRNKTIRLQYSEEFALPPNLRFIGTMNTADRSIRSIDIALRRRFDVFELKPDAGVLRRFFAKNPLSTTNLIEGFEKLNEKLDGDLDRHHTIGHAFFMRPGLDRKMLRAIWDRKIYPLIEEYFFDELDIARKEYVFETFWPE